MINSTGSDNGLAPNRRQAIIWTINGLVWRSQQTQIWQAPIADTGSVPLGFKRTNQVGLQRHILQCHMLYMYVRKYSKLGNRKTLFVVLTTYNSEHLYWCILRLLTLNTCCDSSDTFCTYIWSVKSQLSVAKNVNNWIHLKFDIVFRTDIDATRGYRWHLVVAHKFLLIGTV